MTAGQNYSGQVTLGGSGIQTLNPNGGNVTFAKAVTGASGIGLSVTGPSGTTFINGGTVTTAGVGGNQTYGQEVSLGANTALTAGIANIHLQQGREGRGTATLTITGKGTTNINGGSVTTNADQTYGEAVALGADDDAERRRGHDQGQGFGSVTSAIKNAIFSSAVNFDASATLTIGSGSITFSQPVTGVAVRL